MKRIIAVLLAVFVSCGAALAGCTSSMPEAGVKADETEIIEVTMPEATETVPEASEAPGAPPSTVPDPPEDCGYLWLVYKGRTYAPYENFMYGMTYADNGDGAGGFICADGTAFFNGSFGQEDLPELPVVGPDFETVLWADCRIVRISLYDIDPLERIAFDISREELDERIEGSGRYMAVEILVEHTGRYIESEDKSEYMVNSYSFIVAPAKPDMTVCPGGTAASATSPCVGTAVPGEATPAPTPTPTPKPASLRLSDMSEEDCIRTLREFGAQIPGGREMGIMAMVRDFEEDIDRPYPGDVYFDDEYSLYESVRAAVRAYYSSVGAALASTPKPTPAPTARPTAVPTAVPTAAPTEAPAEETGEFIKTGFLKVRAEGLLYTPVEKLDYSKLWLDDIGGFIHGDGLWFGGYLSDPEFAAALPRVPYDPDFGFVLAEGCSIYRIDVFDVDTHERTAWKISESELRQMAASAEDGLIAAVYVSCRGRCINGEYESWGNAYGFRLG